MSKDNKEEKCECGCHTSEHSDEEMIKNGCDICHELYNHSSPTESEECRHGVKDKKYCFNCKFTEKYDMPIEMFNSHHYVRLKHVEKVLQDQRKKLIERVEGMKEDI